MILAIAKSVHFSSSKHFSNVYRCHVGREKARKREKERWNELGNDVGTRDGDTLACGQQRGTEKERDPFWSLLARLFVCLPTYDSISVSLSLSLGRLVFNPRRTPLMNLEKITDGG